MLSVLNSGIPFFFFFPLSYLYMDACMQHIYTKHSADRLTSRTTQYTFFHFKKRGRRKRVFSFSYIGSPIIDRQLCVQGGLSPSEVIFFRFFFFLPESRKTRGGITNIWQSWKFQVLSTQSRFSKSLIHIYCFKDIYLYIEREKKN